MPASIVQRLSEEHDLVGLQKVLRNRASPGLRIDAAAALGTLGDLEAVEPLARAVLQDPDLEVQKTARRALVNLVGVETDTVIATYRHHLSVTGVWQSGGAVDSKDEEYLQDVQVNRVEPNEADFLEFGEDTSDGSDQAEGEGEWDQQNLDGMIAVLSHETSPKIRLQAINALKNSSNMRAIEALSTIALYDENEEISQAARSALEKRFGEDANSIIDSYRTGRQGEEDNAEELETEDEESDDIEDTFQGPVDIPRTASSFGDPSQSSVIHEDRIGWKLILLVLLVLLIVGGIAFLLLSR